MVELVCPALLACTVEIEIFVGINVCVLKHPRIPQDLKSWLPTRNTVKSVLRDHCHEKLPVLTDHTFLAVGSTHVPTFQYLNLPPETACLDRPHFCGQWGGLSRQVLLYR